MRKSLSHSQMETWQQCPRKWQLQKIERVPQAPSEALILGDAVHAAIQRDGEGLKRDLPPLPMPLLMLHFRNAFADRVRKDDPDGMLAPALSELHARGKAMLQAYLDQVQPHYRPLAVEQSFELAIPDTDWTFTGRIDAITETAIVDFKTASKPWQAGIEHGKEQATAYQLAHPDARRVTFIVFAPDATGSYRSQFRATARTQEQKDSYLQQVRETTAAIANAVASGDFPSRTGPLCGWCPVLGHCAAGQEWLKERGRVPAVPVMTAR